MVSSSARRLFARLAFALACGLMAALPLSHYICVRCALHAGYIAGTLYTFGFLSAAVLAAALVFRAAEPRFAKYEGIFSTLLMFAGLSVLFSSDRHTSLWGSGSRCEGFFMLACYYLFFYLGRLICEPGLQKKLLLVFLGIMFLHCLYGLSQQFHFLTGTFDYYYYAISGVAGNPNFMATLTVMAACIALGMAAADRDTSTRLLCAAFLPVGITTMALTKAVSAVLGMTAVAVFLAVWLWKGGSMRLRRFMIGGLTAATAGVLLLNFLSDQFLVREIQLFGCQLAKLIRTGTLDPEFASGRPYLWYNSLLLFFRQPFTGVGIDNLMAPYYDSYGLFLGQFVDKTHNELLQILVTMGLPACLGYMLLYKSLFLDLVRRIRVAGPRHAAIAFALLLCLIGYLVQACFNISVIDVAPYFWLLCGLMAPLPDKTDAPPLSADRK